MSDSVRPHRRQPTRLPCPWDSPGKNTGVGCHFLLQCVKVKIESEVVQSCPTLSDTMDWSLPGSSVHGIFQARVLECGAIAFSAELFNSIQFRIIISLPACITPTNLPSASIPGYTSGIQICVTVKLMLLSLEPCLSNFFNHRPQ